VTSSLIFSLKDCLLNGSFSGIEALPAGEHNIIVNRFDKLNFTEQVVLKVASVIGDTFSSDFLVEVLQTMGEGMDTAVTGLDVTLQRLQVAAFITQSLDSISSSQIIDDLDSFGFESHVSQLPIIYFQFTARNIKECVYNLMLQSQKETVHSIVGRLLEKRYGTLPELYFLDIAKHFYASNHFQKKLMYLEESLRRAHHDNDTTVIKESLNHLLVISLGFDGDGVIQHFYTPKHLIHQDSSIHLVGQNIPHFLKEIKCDEPLVSKWLTAKQAVNHLTLLDHTHTRRKSVDPFSATFHDRDTSISISEKAMAVVTNDFSAQLVPSVHRSVHVPIKMLSIQNVHVWVSQLSSVHFRSV
jgi:hypothetical protein